MPCLRIKLTVRETQTKDASEERSYPKVREGQPGDLDSAPPAGASFVGQDSQ